MIDHHEPDQGASDKMESERSTGKRQGNSRLSIQRVISVIGQIAQFIGRPDSMTAYATLGAAFAAFLALRAAEHQERATFTSALYGKQVDTLADLDGKSFRLSGLFRQLSQKFQKLRAFTENKTYGDKQSAQVTRLLSEAMEEMEELHSTVYEVIALLSAIDSVYPAEAGGQVKKLSVDLTEIENSMGVLDIGRNTPLDAVNIPGLVTIWESTFRIQQEFLANIIELQACSNHQLREGKFINGREFAECISEFETNKAERH